MMERLGGAYVDFEHKVAVGVDGVYVKSYHVSGNQVRVNLENQLTALPMPFADAFPLDLRLEGLPAGKYQLSINGGAPQPIELPAPKGVRIELGPKGRAAGSRGSTEFKHVV